MGLTSILVILCAGALGMVLLAALIIWLQNRQDDEPTASKARRPAPRPAVSPRLSDEHNFGLKVEVAALLQAGNKIQAIKVYREATGVGLAEAKYAVEAFEQGQMLRIPPAPPPASIDLENRILELLKRKNKIEAIKVYREATGAGLKEAKDAVEAFEQGHRLVMPTEPALAPPATSGDLQAQIIELLRLKNKIGAIKIYREATGADLKEAKDAVEAIERNFI